MFDEVLGAEIGRRTEAGARKLSIITTIVANLDKRHIFCDLE